MTRYDADGNRDTVLNRARRFFADNPDEMLTREDLQVKFNCGPDMASLVARKLIREGTVTRDQLPRPEAAKRRPRVVVDKQLPFPQCMTPGQRFALEAYIAHGNVAAAARATGRNYNTLSDQLKDARDRAGVHTTAALAMKWLQIQAAPAAAPQDAAEGHLA